MEVIINDLEVIINDLEVNISPCMQPCNSQPFELVTLLRTLPLILIGTELSILGSFEQQQQQQQRPHIGGGSLSTHCWPDCYYLNIGNIILYMINRNAFGNLPQHVLLSLGRIHSDLSLILSSLVTHRTPGNAAAATMTETQALQYKSN